MTRFILTLALVLGLAASAAGQATKIAASATLPSKCVAGNLYVKTGTAAGFYVCLVVDAWTGPLSTGGESGAALPAGATVLIDAGTCPTGYAERTALNGKMLRGTLAANGDVGTTGGSDTLTPAGTLSAPALTMNSYTPTGTVAAPALTMASYTPAGTVAAPVFTGTQGTISAHTVSWPAGVPTLSGTAASFTGSALGTHAHELPWQLPSTTTIRQIAVATFGTGTSRAATAVSAAGTANTTSAAVALSQAVTAGTPAGTIAITAAGTIAWPAGVPTMGTVTFTPAGTNSAPAFTGTAATLTGTNTAPAFTGTAATLTGSVAAAVFTGSAANNRPAYTNVIFCQKT